MSKAPTPELKKYMDKRLFVQLNGNRKVTGVLRGYDPFMNIVLDDAVEHVGGNGSTLPVPGQGQTHSLGMVVLRGNSVTVMEVLDRMG